MIYSTLNLFIIYLLLIYALFYRP